MILEANADPRAGREARVLIKCLGWDSIEVWFSSASRSPWPRPPSPTNCHRQGEERPRGGHWHLNAPLPLEATK